MAQPITYFSILLLLLQNFYMSIALQLYPQTNKLVMYALLFFINGLISMGAYFLGKTLMAYIDEIPTYLSVASEAVLLQLLFWSALVDKRALRAILVAQICVCVTLIGVYLIYYLVK